MKQFGYLRAAAIVPVVKVAHPLANAQRICDLIDKAVEEEIALAVFPELSITGYTCQDLFFQHHLLKTSEDAVGQVVAHTKGLPVTVMVGAPVCFEARIYNCAVVINNGSILGIVPKCYIPNYGEFYETRWFNSGFDFTSREGNPSYMEYAGYSTIITPNQLFDIRGVKVGVEICEDLWTPIPRSSNLALAGAELIANLSASNEVVSKTEYRRQLLGAQSGQRLIGYIYCSAGYGESTSGTVYAGESLICEGGHTLVAGEKFSTEAHMTIGDIDVQNLIHRRKQVNTFCYISPDGTPASEYRKHFVVSEAVLVPDTDFDKKLYRPLYPLPFVPESHEMDRKCMSALNIQATALLSRLEAIHCRKVVIGISGGLDSTLALLCAYNAFRMKGWDCKGIIGITMPGYGTSSRTHDNASTLMEALGVTCREISIKDACNQHFSDIGHDGRTPDIAYENAQARERTQILMDVANMENAIVIGTGDLSEIALGWCTYNGDQMSNYSVNASIPKTMIRALVSWAADNQFSDPVISSTLHDIVATPVSPELKADQVTEDVVGPYDLHDFFLYNMMYNGHNPAKVLFLATKAFSGVYTREEIRKWLKTFTHRFFISQFKRAASPEGPKVCQVSLDPRGDWRMPSDACEDVWMAELEED